MRIIEKSSIIEDFCSFTVTKCSDSKWRIIMSFIIEFEETFNCDFLARIFSFFFKKFQLIKVWKHRQGSDILYFDSFVEWNLFNFRKIIMSMKQHPKKMKIPSIVMKTSYHRTEIVTKKQNCCSLILEFNNYQGNKVFPTTETLIFTISVAKW